MASIEYLKQVFEHAVTLVISLYVYRYLLYPLLPKVEARRMSVMPGSDTFEKFLDLCEEYERFPTEKESLINGITLENHILAKTSLQCWEIIKGYT